MTKPIMYHISDRLDWRIGDTLICGEKYNRFWTVCATLDPVTTILGESMTYFELFDKCNALDPAQVDLADLYKNLKDISKECAFYIREQVAVIECPVAYACNTVFNNNRLDVRLICKPSA